jgi:hypothetical protein
MLVRDVSRPGLRDISVMRAGDSVEMKSKVRQAGMALLAVVAVEIVTSLPLLVWAFGKGH